MQRLLDDLEAKALELISFYEALGFMDNVFSVIPEEFLTAELGRLHEAKGLISKLREEATMFFEKEG